MIVFSRLEVDWREQQTLQPTIPLLLQGADVQKDMAALDLYIRSSTRYQAMVN